MTLILELTAEEEAKLAAKARAAGIDDPAEYLREIIGAPAGETLEPQPKEGYEYLKRLFPHIERMSLTDEDLASVRVSE